MLLGVVVAVACAIGVGLSAASGGVVGYTTCHQKNGDLSNAVLVTATASDPLSLRTSWVTSQYGNMQKFLKVQQVSWTVTTSTTTYTDDISTFGDTRYWSSPIQATVNGQQVWMTTFLDNTGIVLAGPPPSGGPGERATLTFSILGQKNQKVYDTDRTIVTWMADPVTQVLTPDQPPPYSPITATCTIEGR